MVQFAAPQDDILFSLIHVADAASSPDWDEVTARDVLGHFAGFAEAVIAPLNAVGDKQGAKLTDGRVMMPDGFADAYRHLAEGGWQGLTGPETWDGMGLSPLISAAVSEVFSGANHAMQMVCNLVPGAIATLLRFGTAAQQSTWIPKLVSGKSLSTMCITEPAAGSDLSAIRCKAIKTDDGWQLAGEKIFISGGDQNMSDEIMHLVLARSGDAGIGGLSLYLCANQDAVRVTRIEEKLGLHASPTCHMVFNHADAELLGVEGQGLAAMFTLMNHARVDVALQGVAHAARASHIAESYAQERFQGRGPNGLPAHLIDHADVRRMLDEQAMLTFGTRAMCHVTLVEIAKGAGPDLIDFLTPLCKIAGSQAGIRAADLGIQILGGYGYLNEYQIGQVWRDARITAIYEGTNGIHSRTIATRGLQADTTGFEALVTRLGGGADLSNWRNLRDTTKTDPPRYAYAFAQATIKLFFDAVWARIVAQADHHTNPAEVRRLHADNQIAW